MRPELNEVGELGIPVDHQPMHLVLDLVLLRVLERDVVLGQPRLPLPILQQDEPDHGGG